MSKISIRDPTIRLKPGPKLCQFIASISDPVELPENILKIYQSYGGDNSVQHKPHIGEVARPNLSADDLELLSKLNRNEIGDNTHTDTQLIELLETDDAEEVNSNDDEDATIPSGKSLSKTQSKRAKEKQKQQQLAKLVLTLNDIKWLNHHLVELRTNDADCKTYLHELLSDAKLVLPQNEIQERDPALEARCVRLRLEQDARMYSAMTRNVDTSRRLAPDDTIAFQMKQINRHLIAVLQFLFSVAAGFAFGFIGVELIIGGLDFGFRLLLGIMCALIIALAEIYFLAKQLNEEFDLAAPVPLKPDANSSIAAGGGTSAAVPKVPKVGQKEHKE